MKLKTKYRKLNADLFTPVSLYLKLRDRYALPLLMESADHSGAEGAMSVICLQPHSSFSFAQNKIRIQTTTGTTHTISCNNTDTLCSEFKHYRNSYETEILPINGPYAGFFGFTSYDLALLKNELMFEDEKNIPLLHYSFYSIVLLFDHFRNELYCIAHADTVQTAELQIETIVQIISNAPVPSYPFNTTEKFTTDATDTEFMQMVNTGIEHCKKGNVFQVVLSRKFETAFTGDEFEVYRALRNVNPSPYLFYFDLADFRIFGSSPEAQLIINNGYAEIHPIAGTAKRSGNEHTDLERAGVLLADAKENAEHIMLVDLARNDLSIHCREVEVKRLKEVQFFSHVIHLVSLVKGRLKKESDPFAVMLDTFPAGTLSGAPKKKALQIIAATEKSSRAYYGGTVGFIDSRENLHHAILIRSFFSRQNTLTLRAGAGVVAASSPQGELTEVNNKLAALKQALQLAGNKQRKPETELQLN